MAGYVGEVRIRTSIDSKGVNAGTKQITMLFRTMTQSISSGSMNMSSIVNMATSSMAGGWTIAGVAIAAAVGMIIKKFVELTSEA